MNAIEKEIKNNKQHRANRKETESNIVATKCVNKRKIYERNNERKKFFTDGIYYIKMICLIK